MASDGSNAMRGVAPGSAQGQQQQQQFSLRIVYIDYYMRRPVQGLHHCYSELQGCAVALVPVIRVFGATPSGQKACLHLHKVPAAFCGLVWRPRLG